MAAEPLPSRVVCEGAGGRSGAGGAGSDAITTVVALAGYPDDLHAFDDLAPHMGDLRLVALCLPCYDGDAGLPPGKRWGYTFPEMVDMCAAAIEAHVPEGERCCLVCHDWGVVVALNAAKWACPSRVGAVAILDIGCSVKGAALRARDVLSMVVYQGLLAATFCASAALRGVADAPLSLVIVAMFASPLKWLISPLPTERTGSSKANPTHPWMCYPYFHMWRGILTGFGRVGIPIPPEGTPWGFAYGGGKRTMFHSPQFLEVAAAKGVCCECFEGAGHWFFREEPGRAAALVKKIAAAGRAKL